MKILSLSLLALCAAFVQAQYAGTQPVPAQYKKGVDAIKIEDAQKILGYLAGPECEGRGTMQPGFQKAAQFVASKFKEYGLRPVGDSGTYFQMVHFAATKLRPADSGLTSVDGKTKLTGEEDMAYGRLGRNTDVVGDTLFLRVGSGDNLHIDGDFKGKFVFVVGSMSRAMRTELGNRNAAAIIQVSDDVYPSRGSARGVTSKSLIGCSIKKDAAAKVAQSMGLPDSTVDKSTIKDGTVEMVPGKSRLRLVAKFDETDPLDVPNVVGYLPGSDPTLKTELVGIGAHLDHLGKRGDTVYPGADDDGSGSTAVMEIVKAFHDGGIKPKRSILFMTFCGEEMGLIGSSYYSDNPIFPHENMIAELQMDMVARDSYGAQNGDRNRMDKLEENMDTMRLVGSKRISTDLHNKIMEINKYIGFQFKWDAEDVYTRSDHYNFAKVGIPIAFLFDGFTPDYHQPSDTVDKIDWKKLTNAAKLYYMVALELANGKERPKHDVPQTGND